MTEGQLGGYILSEHESEEIFRSAIVPDELSRGTRQDVPVVVYIAGQQGSGKTRTTASIMEVLAQRGGAGLVTSDYYKPYHPAYHYLMATADQNMAAHLGPDGQRWARKAEAYLRQQRVDVVIETTMQNPAYFRESVRQYRQYGYRAEVAFLAVPEALSRQGILHRYAEQVADRGHGRLTDPGKHEHSYRGVLATADLIDAEHLADTVVVLRRGNTILYANHVEQNMWVSEPATRAAIEAERSRSWTPDEVRQFWQIQNHLRIWLGSGWRSELDAVGALAPHPHRTPPSSPRGFSRHKCPHPHVLQQRPPGRAPHRRPLDLSPIRLLRAHPPT
ncbi:zeta toxin family protein [Nonomuraea jabiensis]|uniref:zeta toxin family protein n=1 Tax=Nonomuraea jabiensis TaxID=882448 RepID=UPI003D722E24